jgi:MoaA/NifB/PqqE/SkfB family radical SAM enzyme
VTAEETVLSFTNYQPSQRERLRALVETPQWQTVLTRGSALQQWKAQVRVPPSAPGQQAMAADFLKGRNAERVQGLLRQGVRDEKVLVEALGNWETALAGDERFPMAFLGLVLTLDCHFLPRCLYCNQTWLPRRLTVDDWKALLQEAAEPTPPYVYLTGGEPLQLGAEVWGDEGLVAFATKLGCAVNINTNAVLITPQVALQLVKVGLARLHISVDSADPQVQAELFQGASRAEAVWKGILNVQIAREVLGANHPQIHINCVLTARNLFGFPELLRSLLEVRKVRSDGYQGKTTDDPLFRDFAFHLIPVGGSENALIRPTAEEWKRFYTETWAEAEQVWEDYQTAVGVPQAERKPLAGHVPFASPFLRAEHHMSLDEYCEMAARGVYWQGALTDRCYVAPTQAFVLPDGSLHWCGAHAIRRPRALGDARQSGLRDTIRANLARLSGCPNEFCSSCAGATCVINQGTERALKDQVAKWLRDYEPSPSDRRAAS